MHKKSIILLSLLLLTSCNSSNTIKLRYNKEDVYCLSILKNVLSSSTPISRAVYDNKAKELYTKYVDLDYKEINLDNNLTYYPLSLWISSYDNTKGEQLSLEVSKDLTKGYISFSKQDSSKNYIKYYIVNPIDMNQFSTDFEIDLKE